MLHDSPRRGAFRVAPEGEAEASPLLLGHPVFSLPLERVRARLGREVAVDAQRRRGELRQSELGQPREVVLVVFIVVWECCVDRERERRGRKKGRERERKVRERRELVPVKVQRQRVHKVCLGAKAWNCFISCFVAA